MRISDWSSDVCSSDLVGAISCGIYKGTPVLDLDYDEDSVAEADGNFVLTGKGQIVEVQASAEGATYDEEGLHRLIRLARIGCGEILAAQAKAVGRELSSPEGEEARLANLLAHSSR